MGSERRWPPRPPPNQVSHPSRSWATGGVLADQRAYTMPRPQLLPRGSLPRRTGGRFSPARAQVRAAGNDPTRRSRKSRRAGCNWRRRQGWRGIGLSARTRGGSLPMETGLRAVMARGWGRLPWRHSVARRVHGSGDFRGMGQKPARWKLEPRRPVAAGAWPDPTLARVRRGGRSWRGAGGGRGSRCAPSRGRHCRFPAETPEEEGGKSCKPVTS